jgi:hypothetical protein
LNTGTNNLFLKLLQDWQHVSLTSSDSPKSNEAPTLMQLPVSAPSGGASMTYTQLFHDLLREKDMLLLGLYRPVKQQRGCFYCVLTNPGKDTLVTSQDKAFVVGRVGSGGGVGGVGFWPGEVEGTLLGGSAMRKSEATGWASRPPMRK